MRIFLTGATGFIGSAVASELLQSGHQVIGMARSDGSARALQALGAEVHRGTLEDVASVQSGTEKADAVIHTAFDHDFSRFVENCEKDRRVIGALGQALKGSNRPLLITSVTGVGATAHGQLAREDIFNASHRNPRIASELAGNALLDSGIHVCVVRLPQVHTTEKQGLITPLLERVREKGVAAYIGEGRHRWPAAHRSDVALLYRLAIENGEPGARYHAVSEEGIEMREISHALARGLGIKVASIAQESAADYFGWLAMFAGMDMPASSEQTRAKLGWNPRGPTLIADLEAMSYA